jgi:hypothetical protein
MSSGQHASEFLNKHVAEQGQLRREGECVSEENYGRLLREAKKSYRQQI